MSVKARPGDDLTDAERAVGELVARGRANAEIAAERSTSIRTVHAHLRNLYAKTGTQNRVELANWLRAAPAHRRPDAGVSPVPAPRNAPAQETEQPVTAFTTTRAGAIRIRFSRIEPVTIRHISATLADGEHVRYARQDGTTMHVRSLSVGLTGPRRDVSHVAVHGTTADGRPARDTFAQAGRATPPRALELFCPPELAQLTAAVIEADDHSRQPPAAPPDAARPTA